jgi:uncharacterized membrane protein YphA (DoxX/SURF4 family)
MNRPGDDGDGAPGAHTPGRTGFRAGAELALARAEVTATAWAPTAARMLLGLVLLWFGYHELVDPGLWTGYVPVFSATSNLAQILVLAHGWLLLVLAVALLTGIAPRVAASLAALLLLEIIISLGVHGLSDLVLRDVGVFGLALAVAGAAHQRLLLR